MERSHILGVLGRLLGHVVSARSKPSWLALGLMLALVSEVQKCLIATALSNLHQLLILSCLGSISVRSSSCCTIILQS